MAKNSKEELAEYRRKVLEEHRGRRPKIPYETSALRAAQKIGAAKAYTRLEAAAQSVALRKKQFGEWKFLNMWLYEIYHGRPKMAMEGEVKIPIQVTFKLAKPPGPECLTHVVRIDKVSGVINEEEEYDKDIEYHSVEAPEQLTQEGENGRDIKDKSADFANPDAVN